MSKITGIVSAEGVSDGAVLQRDGEMVEVGSYDILKRLRHLARLCTPAASHPRRS
jgi:hypothetical protein